MNNYSGLFLAESGEASRSELELATVGAVYSDGVSIIPDGQSSASQKHYTALTTGHALAAGDRIVVVKMSGSYIVLGRIRADSGDPGVSLVTTASEIVTAGTGWSIDSASFARWGHIAMLRIDMHTTQAMTTTPETVLATVVSGKRPKITAPCQVGFATDRIAIIQTNGNLQMNGYTLASGVSYTFMSVYLLA